jgi:hypothetical protein
MKKLSYLIILALILGLVLTGCLLSNVGQVPATEQSGIAYLTKGLSSGLVGLWSFEEGEDPTIAYDSSAYGNDGIITGATYVGSANTMFGDALNFDGVDDYVDFGSDTSLELANKFTIELWVKRTDKTNFERFLSHSINASTYAYEVGVDYLNPNQWRLRLNSDDVTLKVEMAGQAGQWIHVAFVYDNSLASDNMKIYENGTLVASGDYDKSLANHGTLRTNRQGKDDGWLKSTIDEVRIYDYALSPDTIADHAAGIYGFNGLLAPYAPPPDQKIFKLGRTIPLKWQYTGFDGNVVDSFDANPEVNYQFVGGESGNGELVITDDPGSSGFHYDTTLGIWKWQFNWQTKGLEEGIGTYKIWITSIQTGQVNGPFLIELR